MATLNIKTTVDTSQVDKMGERAEQSSQKAKKGVDEVGTATTGVSNKLDRMSGGAVTAFRSFVAGGKSAVIAMTTLRGAIAATGIGALVLVIASLVSYFTKTQRGADLLSRATKALGATMDVLVDRVSALGEFLFKAFQDPQQAVKDFSQTIQDFVMRRVEEVISGFTGLGTTIKLIFEGEFTEALKTGQEALGNLASGMIPVIGLAKDSKDAIKGVVDEIKNETAAAYNLEKAQQALRDREIDFIKVKAQARAEIEKARLAAEDETKTDQERAAALQKAIDVQTEVTDKEISIEKERARIIRERVALGESMASDLEDQARAEARVIELESQRDRMLRSISTRLNAFTKDQKEATKSTEDLAKAEEERLKQEAEKRKNLLLELNNEMREIQLEQDELEIERLLEFERRKMEIKLNNEQLTEAQKQEIRLDFAEKEKELREDVAKKEIDIEKIKKDATLGIAKQTLDVAMAFAGEGTKAAKALSAAQIVFDTIQGAQSAFTTAQKSPITAVFPGYPFVQAGLATAFGVASLNKLRSASTSGGSGVSAPSGGGRSGGGGAQAQQQRIPNVDFANRGVGGDQGGLEPARAYVVNQEIKDKSKLAQRIEDSARLG